MASPITSTKTIVSPLGNQGAFTDYTLFSDGSCFDNITQGNTMPFYSEKSDYAFSRDQYKENVYNAMNKRFLY